MMANNNQQQHPIYCRNQCGVEIIFDNRKSKSGKSIPIEKSSGMPHQCPKSPYALQSQQQQQESSRINSATQAQPTQDQQQDLQQQPQLKIIDARLTRIMELLVSQNRMLSLLLDPAQRKQLEDLK